MDRTSAMFLEHEARALSTRLDRIKPFALSETMVPAASLAPGAQRAIDSFMAQARAQLRAEVSAFLEYLDAGAGYLAPWEAQRRFTGLRMRFNTVCTQFDMFADALAQRSAHEIGVWLAGLDRLALDALALPGYYEAPPLICYLERGIGAAIRRARTRLPGGRENPLALIRVPRERMVGSAIASSLVHEVGHQAAALLDLVECLRAPLRGRIGAGARQRWIYWERWASEIIADLWSVANLGVAATLGTMSVLSLPRPFVFRVSLDDPHPAPWLRVKLSCAMGEALYPHAQWQRVFELWNALHPLQSEDRQLALLHDGAAEFVDLLLGLRAPSLHGRTLAQVLRNPELQRDKLAARHQRAPLQLSAAVPCLACATLGQARLDGLLDPEAESQVLQRLLVRWALDNTFGSQPRPLAAGSLLRASH